PGMRVVGIAPLNPPDLGSLKTAILRQLEDPCRKAEANTRLQQSDAWYADPNPYRDQSALNMLS
ncbi:hypothetical protein, partial [Hyphomonas beringensis]|uniref:hypothetical protein n=1 Tax=Hyphomonas beringensis TaxID=1280946 RepID=UPI0019D6B001